MVELSGKNEGEKVHTRSINVEVWKLKEGLWKLVGTLIDKREKSVTLRTGVSLAAGAPLHKMVLRLTVDAALTIVSAEAETWASPFPGICENVVPDYVHLAGLRIQPGFKQEVMRLFGGMRGCTHITELSGSVAAAAVQAISSELEKQSGVKPSKLDTCHALNVQGNAVARYYPEWYVGTK